MQLDKTKSCVMQENLIKLIFNLLFRNLCDKI